MQPSNKTSNFANQYRPTTFSEVVGQELVVQTLKRVAKADGMTVRSIFLKGSYGSGKCIAAHQRVLTKSFGYRRIIDLAPEEKASFTDGFYPLEITVETSEGPHLTSHFYRESNCVCNYVTTSSGHVLTGTDNHRILSTTDPNKEASLRPIKDIKVGDYLVFPNSPVRTLKEVDLSKLDLSIIHEAFEFFQSDDEIAIPEHFFHSREAALSAIIGLLSTMPTSADNWPDLKINLHNRASRQVVIDLFDYFNCHVAVMPFGLYGRVLLFETPAMSFLQTLFKLPIPYIDDIPVLTNLKSVVRSAPVFEAPVTYSPVVSKSQVVTNVYDLSVPEVHTFFSGGLLNHNTTLSRIFAKALNCEQFKKTGEVCNQCASCKEVMSPTSQLYMELDATRAGNVDSVRDLTERLAIRPNGRRLVCLDEIHACSTQALNALLKIVEEGVPQTMFIFCSTEDILPTIKSRSLCLDISPIPLPLVEAKIREVALSRGLDISQEDLSVLSMKCQGHMRDAYQYLQLYEIAGSKGLDSSYNLFRSMVLNSFSKSPKRSPYEILEDVLKYPISDIKMSIGVFIRNIFTASEGTPEYKLHQAGLGASLFTFFFTPTAQQAMREEVGMEILLRSFVDKATKR